MAHDRRRQLRIFSDKLAVRRYVRKRIGAQHLPTMFLSTSRPTELDFSGLPRNYVIKVNHGCGGIMVFSEVVDSETQLPDQLEKTEWKTYFFNSSQPTDARQITQILDHWLHCRYANSDSHYEWAYQGIRPSVLIEELIPPGIGSLSSPIDYKFFCFDGQVKMVKVILDRHSDEIFKIDLKGDFLPFSKDIDDSQLRPLLPNLDQRIQMRKIAEQLSAGLDFLRVDLYQTGNRILFGELTAYPAGGFGVFNPPELDEYLGAQWTYFKKRGRPFVCNCTRSKPFHS